MTEVAAALIWDKERFLICRRPEGKPNGGLWEFPGGKAEPGETLPQGLIRECREELGVTLAVGRQLAETAYSYPDRTIRLTLWEAVIVQGQPQLLEHTEFQWVAPAELPSEEAASEGSFRFFCPADRAFLELLRREGKSPQKRIQERLFSLQDLSYRDFHSRLMPTVPLEQVIGVRVPILRRYAKELSKTPEAALFLHCLPHFYYEENNLHGFLLEEIKDYSQAVAALEGFLPYVDNWATCDMVSPKAFALSDAKGKGASACSRAAGAMRNMDGFLPSLHRAFWHGDADAVFSWRSVFAPSAFHRNPNGLALEPELFRRAGKGIFRLPGLGGVFM